MFLQEEIAGRVQVSIMSKFLYDFVGLCVMVCTYWLVCHGVHSLDCVSWCVLVGLCVMVCTCWLVCHGVYLLTCVSWCALVGLCVMLFGCVMSCHDVYCHVMVCTVMS